MAIPQGARIDEPGAYGTSALLLEGSTRVRAVGIAEISMGSEGSLGYSHSAAPSRGRSCVPGAVTGSENSGRPVNTSHNRTSRVSVYASMRRLRRLSILV